MLRFGTGNRERFHSPNQARLCREKAVICEFVRLRMPLVRRGLCKGFRCLRDEAMCHVCSV